MAAILPKHVAIIMDGNGRWAKSRCLPRIAGHKAGVESVREVVRVAAEKGIEVLTLFAFSTENWKRPAQEVSTLMELFLLSLQREVKQLNQNGIRLKFIGEWQSLESKLVACIQQAQQLTQQNTRLTLVIAVNYGGRWDILNAAKRLASQVQAGQLAIADINENVFNAALELGDLPEPDLLIRTSGEQRISNFLNWQLAYCELYFTDVLWPDFREADFVMALQQYSVRQRRFGSTEEPSAKANDYA